MGNRSISGSSSRKNETSFSDSIAQKMSHDRFTYLLFSHNSFAIPFLKYFLPLEILNEVEIDQLELFPSKFVDQYGKEKIGDVFFQVPLKRGGKKPFVIYLEHKSQRDRNVPLQMAGYDVDLLKFMSHNSEQYADCDGKIPSPYPFLFTQVPQPSFNDTVSRISPNAQYGISFECQTVDISKLNLEELRSVACLFAALSLLKIAKEPLDQNWEEKKERLFEVFDVLASDLSTPEAQEFYQEYATGFLNYSAYFLQPFGKVDEFIDDLRQHEEKRFEEDEVELTVMQRFFRKELAGALEELQSTRSDLSSVREQLTQTREQLTQKDEQLSKKDKQLSKVKREKVTLLQSNIVSLLQSRFQNILPPILCQNVQTINSQKKLEDIFHFALNAPLDAIESKIKLICL